MSEFVELSYTVNVLMRKEHLAGADKKFEQYVDEFECIGLHDLTVEKIGFEVASCYCELCELERAHSRPIADG